MPAGDRSITTRTDAVTTARCTATWHSPTPLIAPEYWRPAPTQPVEDFASPVSSATSTTSWVREFTHDQAGDRVPGPFVVERRA